MELHLKISGFVLIMLSFIHFIFPKYFNWKNELGGLSLINRQMMSVHTFFIAFFVMLMGLLCITSSVELLETSLGKKVILGLFIFWAARLVVQFFGYSPKLWRGKKFETVVHVVFSILLIYLTAVFLYAFWNNRSF